VSWLDGLAVPHELASRELMFLTECSAQPPRQQQYAVLTMLHTISIWRDLDVFSSKSVLSFVFFSFSADAPSEYSLLSSIIAFSPFFIAFLFSFQILCLGLLVFLLLLLLQELSEVFKEAFLAPSDVIPFQLVQQVERIHIPPALKVRVHCLLLAFLTLLVWVPLRSVLLTLVAWLILKIDWRHVPQ